MGDRKTRGIRSLSGLFCGAWCIMDFERKVGAGPARGIFINLPYLNIDKIPAGIKEYKALQI